VTTVPTPPRPRFGLYGAAIQLALALGLGIFVSAARFDELGPRDQVVRGVALGLLFAVPGVIAWLGARSGRPALLVAAVAMDMAGVLLSFATLVFVVPAGLFVAHAAATMQGPPRVAAAVRAAVVGVALVALVVGAGSVVLTTTESRCWTAYSTPTGVEYRFSPYVGNNVEVSVPLDALASGCDTGVLTAQGVATAAVLELGAIALAGVAGRRRPEPATT
jgi:hypothetical protein